MFRYAVVLMLAYIIILGRRQCGIHLVLRLFGHPLCSRASGSFSRTRPSSLTLAGVSQPPGCREDYCNMHTNMALHEEKPSEIADGDGLFLGRNFLAAPAV
jgi:hypothetical protein